MEGIIVGEILGFTTGRFRGRKGVVYQLLRAMPNANRFMVFILTSAN